MVYVYSAAIKVCARKIANFYGDLRRALQVLRYEMNPTF